MGISTTNDPRGLRQTRPESVQSAPAIKSRINTVSKPVNSNSQKLAEYVEDDDDESDEENPVESDLEDSLSSEDGNGDDDDYSGIPGVSDDEESGDEANEGALLRAAEDDLIHEFKKTEHRRHTSLVASEFDNMFLQDDNADDDNWNLMNNAMSTTTTTFNMNDDPFIGLASNDSLYQEMWTDAENALSSWRMPTNPVQRTVSHDSNGTKKRVRFEEETVIEVRSRASSSSGSEDPNEAFPDLFTAQDDPLLRQRFAVDIDPDATFNHEYSDTGSCYDFDGDEERLALQIDDELDSDEDDAGSILSFNDEGDTTDEETEEECLARMRVMQRARGILRSPRLAPTTPKAVKKSPSNRSRLTPRPITPKSNRGPQSGKFSLDAERATITESTGEKVKFIPPSKPLGSEGAFWRRAKSAVSSRQISPISSPGLSFHSPAVAQAPARPFTVQSTLGSMFDGNLDFLRATNDLQVTPDVMSIAPPPSSMFRPQTSFGSNTMTEDSDAELEDIDMRDFINIDEQDSDSDDDDARAMQGLTNEESFDVSAAHSTEYGLLDHLDQQRGLVGSFRLNQTHAKHVSSLASHPAKRALTSESNALQKGRRAAANTPMTPARKKRGSQDLGLTGAGIRKIASSPLTNRRPRSRGASLSASGMQQTLGPSIM